MQRRNFLAAMGTAAAGTAGAMGTGAFTSVSANRTVSVSVADDADALLRLSATSGPNAEYADTSGDAISIDISTDEGATGVNANALTKIFEIFSIENQGTQPVAVHVPPSSVSPASAGAADGDYSGFYLDPQFTNRPNGGYDAGPVSGTVVYYLSGGESNFVDAAESAFDNEGGIENYVLGTGQSMDFGLYIDAEDSGPSSDIDFSISADAEVVPDDF